MAGFNPFLAQSVPQYIPPAPCEEPQISNPFLSFAPEPAGAAQDNPFLSGFSDAPAAQYEQPSSGGASNPFADFFSSPAPAQQQQQQPVYVAPTQTTQMYSFEPISAGDQPQQWQMPAVDSQQPVQSLIDSGPGEVVVPTSLANQFLIDTVTGALEATSDSLLDRLRVNQPSPCPGDTAVDLATTPSPIRTPSPEPDLWGAEAPAAPPPSANPLAPSPQPLLDLFDTPQSSKQKTPFEILDLYNIHAPATKPAAQPAPTAEQPPTDILIQTGDPPPQEPQPPPAVVPVLIETSRAESIDQPLPPPPTTQEMPPISPPEKERETEIITPMDDLPPPPPEEIHPPSTVAPAAAVVLGKAPPPIPQGSPARSKPPERPKPPPAMTIAHSPVQEIKSPPTATHHVPPPVPPPAVTRSSPMVEERPIVVKSPVQEVKPMPSRPPPPVPPPSRAQPQQVPSYQPPPVSAPVEVPAVISPPATAAVPSYQPPETQAQSYGAAPSNNFINQGPETPEITQGSAFFSSTITGSDAFCDVGAISYAPPAATTASSRGGGFDDFDSKFDSAPTSSGADAFGDAFGGGASTTAAGGGDSAWGSSGGSGAEGAKMGFGNEDGFDSFLSITEPPPVPQSTQARSRKQDSEDFDREEGNESVSVTIKPRCENDLNFGLAPALAPPPKSPAISTSSAYSNEGDSTFVPFLSTSQQDPDMAAAQEKTQLQRTDSTETPQSPLFEEDTSQPLEEFPRVKWVGEGWEMQMRHPNKKKLTGQRFWKKVYVRVAHQNDVAIVQIFNKKDDRDPIQEIPLQPCYSVSEICAQQFDQFGKIFTTKIQYVYYKERPGIRPGQISKANTIGGKLSQFAAFAIQGDYEGVKQFGSDLKKIGTPIEHAPQISQLVKLGTQNYEELKQFCAYIEENLFKLNIHRDRTIAYKTEEIQITLVDEYYTEQDIYGVVTRQIARVRLFFLSFLSGTGDIEMGLNDLRRQGKEVVGRHDIIQQATEEWIRMENIEMANCIETDEFERSQTIKFRAPDACLFELLRFRVRPPRQRELPLQVKTVFTTTGQKIEIRSDILVPGFTSRKLGQIPCEDVMIKIPIPEAWLYMFRVEKHFRYGSVKSAHRRSGKVKGIERFLGAVDAVEQSLMETTSGQAKYEHQHRAIVWRIPRLPKEGQGAYTTHSFFCHVQIQAHEKMPDDLTTIAKYCYVEFTMPHTVVSHTVCRSISCPDADEPPEKCVRYLARNEYIVEIEHTVGITPGSYSIAAKVDKPPPPPPIPEVNNQKDSDSDFSE